MSGFVHLHCHSTWSLLDGAIPAEALAHVAADLGFEAVALTDHDALTGAVRFSRACRDAGIKPIFGAELTVRAREAMTGTQPLSLAPGRRPASTVAEGRRSFPSRVEHVTVIARDKTGYGNLCRLISDAHLSNQRGDPATTLDAIAARSEGLFVLSGCARGEVARLAAAGRIPDAIDAARRWRDAIGDDYRVEVFDHRGYGHRALRDRLLHVARAVGVRAVATNDVHYAIPEHAGVHEVLHAIKDIVPLSKRQALRGNAEYSLKHENEMQALFADVPEVVDETVKIAEACDFDLDLGVPHFPNVPLPPGATPTGLLAHRCYEGARRRYGSISSAVEDRLQHELQLIFRMGFASYFILVADIVDHTKRVLQIRCACRGSAAGSLVCYVLGISDVDPIAYDLLFERFINARRKELPDIDIDVESHRREEVLDHILDTYGGGQTAVCCMVDTFRARMAIRDIGKALGLPGDEIDLVAKAFPRVAARDIPAAIERLPELYGTNLDGGQLGQLFELCLAIDGFPRHLALHPSGVILSSPDLAERVPMQESFGGFAMLQADKDDVEELGLVKLDVLGVRMLSAMAHARAEISRSRDNDVDLDDVPLDDEATFELIKSSKTLGCFQIESPGQRELLARLQPSRFEDLIVDISLFRPGPVKSDMVTPYLERRHGFEDVSYAHPGLRSVLLETHGVVVYHEQVIRVIAAATGCSLDDADYIRRHLEPEAEMHGVAGRIDIVPPGKDIASWFKSAATNNGFTAKQAESLWKEVFSFASFGFCKSHAAAFALPTYLSAWLKAHYPAEFFAGVLTHEPGMYPRRAIVADARQLGVPVLPVDINASDATYRVEPVSRGLGGGRRSLRSAQPLSLAPGRRPPSSDGEEASFPEADLRRRQTLFQRMPSERSEAGRPKERGAPQPEAAPFGVRMALSEVRDISKSEIDSVVAARRERPFASLEDLWRRTELSHPVVENLIHMGALDSFERRSRRELLWRAVELSSEPRPRRGSQLQLPLDEPIREVLSGLAAYTPFEETQAELEISGIDARRHLMDLYAPLTQEVGCVVAADLRNQRNNSRVWVAGAKVASQTPAIRSGERIIFLTLDDPTGLIDVTAFERVQPRCARTIFHSWVLLVKGVVRKRGGASMTHAMDPDNVGVTVVAEEVFDLAELGRDRANGCSVEAALERQRERQSTAALVRATGDPAAAGPLWHSSGGSAGR